MRFPLAGVALVLALVGCKRDHPPDPNAKVRVAPKATANDTRPPTHQSWGQPPPTIPAELKRLELARQASDERLSSALGAAASRDAASWVLGRIGGPRAAKHFEAVVTGGDHPPSPSELAAVAFLEPPADAFAREPTQAQWRQLEDALWTRYALAQDNEEHAALLLAIARVGGPRSQTRLAADLAEAPSDAEVPRAVRALEAMGMLCARDFGVDGKGVEALANALGSDDALRRAAAYALGRCAGPSAEQLAGQERENIAAALGPMLALNDDTARLAWKALGALAELPKSIGASILGQAPPPWTVEVEAVRALSAHADGRRELVSRLAEVDPKAFTGPRLHVLLEALRGVRDGVQGDPKQVDQLQPLKQRLVAAQAEAKDDHRRKGLSLARCELSALELLQQRWRASEVPVVDDKSRAVEQCSAAVPGLPADFGARVLGDALTRTDPEYRVQGLVDQAADPRPAVAEVALSSLADVDDARVNALLRKALQGTDVGVLAAAAASIAARAVDRSRRDESAVPVLQAAVDRLHNGDALEARALAIEALGNLARSRPAPSAKSPAPEGGAAWLESSVLPLASDPAVAIRRVARKALAPQSDLIRRFDATVTPAAQPFGPQVTASYEGLVAKPVRALRVKTDAGTFEIDFRGVAAPFAQGVLVDLARSGYFDGLTFHRVVPSFVIQGGDPRGDGYGGPGFIVPCERTNLQYVRGTVGIALAGQDTGGSQFFVTHVPEPRLDARYPIVGFVSDEDMAVVDAVLAFDRIVSVEVVEGAS